MRAALPNVALLGAAALACLPVPAVDEGSLRVWVTGADHRVVEVEVSISGPRSASRNAAIDASRAVQIAFELIPAGGYRVVASGRGAGGTVVRLAARDEVAIQAGRRTELMIALEPAHDAGPGTDASDAGDAGDARPGDRSAPVDATADRADDAGADATSGEDHPATPDGGVEDALAADAAPVNDAGLGYWFKVDSANGLSRRTPGCMAYDEQRGTVVLFGGGVQITSPPPPLWPEFSANDETWELAGQTWSQRQPGDHPSARGGCAMVYDSQRHRILLFGGEWNDDHGNRIDFDELWSWDGMTWTLIPANNRPPARASHGLVYDPVRDRVVLFGGNSTRYFGDTWEWDGTTWIELLPDPKPFRRSGPRMVYDPTTQRTRLFGGSGELRRFEDSWSWDGASWTELHLPAGPQASSAYDVGWDAASQRVVAVVTSPATATWRLDGDSWSLLPTVDAPTPRAMPALVYDRGKQRLVLFGGRDDIGHGWALDDTWVYLSPAAIDALSPHGSLAAGFPKVLAQQTSTDIGITAIAFDAASDLWTFRSLPGAHGDLDLVLYKIDRNGLPGAGFPKTFDVAGRDDSARDVAIDAFEQVWVVGDTQASDGSVHFALWQFDLAGELTPGFPVTDSAASAGDGLAVDPAGGLWAVGSAADHMAVWSYDATGALLAGFPELMPFDSRSVIGEAASGAVVDAHGDLWVTGLSYTQQYQNQIALWKLDASGQLLAGFPKTAGRDVSDFGVDIAIDVEGSVWVGAQYGTSASHSYCGVLKYDAAGELEPGFPVLGQTADSSCSSDTCYGIAIDHAGWVWAAGATSLSTVVDAAALWKYSPRGEPVPGFPIVRDEDSGAGAATAVGVASDGAVWMVGLSRATDQPMDLLVYRFQ